MSFVLLFVAMEAAQGGDLRPSPLGDCGTIAQSISTPAQLTIV